MGMARAFARRQHHGAFTVAEEDVFSALESQWSVERGHRVRIPQGVRRKMRNQPEFKAMVALRVRDGVIILDGQERMNRRHDGQVEDRLVAQLGDDPAAWFCECGEEKQKPDDELCPACQQAEDRFQKT